MVDVDSTVTDVNEMRVVDLRKELKSRGLTHTGGKAELVARLQAAMAQDQDVQDPDEHADINLDSDEIDSDGVLEEDDKSHDILDSTEGTLNEAIALDEPTPIEKPAGESKPRTLKRRKVSEADKEKTTESKEGHKKIVLNRAISVPSLTPQPVSEKVEEKPVEENPSPGSNKVKIVADLDSKTKLELRAKRFGLPVKVTDADRKEARKLRFGQNATSLTSSLPSSETEKLKKRAERFGQSVSKVMIDLENKERIEKRRAKFGSVK